MQLIIAGLIWITRTGRPWVICRHRRPLQFRIILMWHHPKYYKELERIRKQQEQADKRASEQARRVGGPTSNEPASEQASDQASEEDASKQR